MAKFICLNKYKKLLKKDNSWESYLGLGIKILVKYYTYFDCTIVIGKMDKGGSPVICSSGNNIWSGVIFIDPEAGFKEQYDEETKNRKTIARDHMTNLKKADIPLKQKKLIDFVLGVAHEIGHLRLAQGRTESNLGKLGKYDKEADLELTQTLEYEAEREVYFLANELKYKDKTWLDIIEPEPIKFEHNLKDTLFYVKNKLKL